METCAKKGNGADMENYFHNWSFSKHVHLYILKTTAVSLSLPVATECSACLVMESSRRAQCGRPWLSPLTTSWTTWWPSWTSTAWARATRLHCSTTWRSTSGAAKPSGELERRRRLPACYGGTCVAALKASPAVFSSWHAVIVDGHSVEELCKVLSQPRHQPLAVIAKTVKGKGIPGTTVGEAHHLRLRCDWN